jgi:lysozyme
MHRRCLAALIAALLLIVAGCGGNSSSRPSQPAAPESARTPDGAKPASPPLSLPRLVGPAKHIDVAGLHLLESFEGFISCPYRDAVGVWTRGFGQTHHIGPGSPCISRAGAEAELRRSVESEYEWALRALGVPLNRHQWDALCSFTYNLGAGIFQGTTVGADLRARAFYSATRVMLQYDHAGGIVLPGLATRRRAEVRLFLTPVSHPKPKPRSPAAKRRLVAHWKGERHAVLHRYHLDGCRGSSTGPKCTALRRREHELWADIKRLR